jgi:hypothetical protein
MTNTSTISEDADINPIHFATGMFVLAVGGWVTAMAVLIIFFR